MNEGYSFVLSNEICSYVHTNNLEVLNPKTKCTKNNSIRKLINRTYRTMTTHKQRTVIKKSATNNSTWSHIEGALTIKVFLMNTLCLTVPTNFK